MVIQIFDVVKEPSNTLVPLMKHQGLRGSNPAKVKVPQVLAGSMAWLYRDRKVLVIYKQVINNENIQ